MPAVKITLELDEATGRAYRNATPEQQRRAQERAQQSIQRALMASEEVGAEFDRIRAKSVPYAQAQGWTDEMNEALLRGDYDND